MNIKSTPSTSSHVSIQLTPLPTTAPILRHFRSSSRLLRQNRARRRLDSASGEIFFITYRLVKREKKIYSHKYSGPATCLPRCEHDAVTVDDSGRASSSAMSLPEEPSADPQPLQPSTSASSDAQNEEQLVQHPAHPEQGAHQASPGSHNSRGRSPGGRPSSSAERRGHDREPWASRENNATGLTPDDRRDREDPDPRYAPINNAPTQGQICR